MGMRDPARANRREEDLPPPRLIAVLAPVVALVAVCALAALGTALAGFHRDEMLVVAGAAGPVVALAALFLIYLQVADRNAAQRRLQDVQARVGGIVESAMDAIVSVDEGQRVVQFNAAAERVFRLPRTAVLGQRLDMLIPKQFHEAHRGHIERFGRTATTSRGMGAQTVLHGVRADGEEFPIEASISQHAEGGRKLFTVILRDVTERVHAEQLLARSEARLRGILDSAMDAIITVDDRQHIVIFNAAAEVVFGCPREQAIGAPLAWFIPERFRDGHAGHLARFASTSSASRRMGEQRIVVGLRRSGEEFPIDASISQVSDGGQHFFTVILRDVTARVRAEQELRRSREEIKELALAASNLREQEKRRVARELHDELGQALTALKIDVGWLRDNVTGASAEVKQKLGSMQLLLDGTVAATRRISADLRPLVLDDLGLAAAADWLVQNFTMRTGIACELAVSHGLELEDPYATTIFRVLQESLTNVAKHAEASQVEVTLERSGDQVTISVTDNGRGFSPQAPRKPASYGLLGLRERAILLGGEATIDSAPGRGTSIEVRLPLREMAAAE
jgi:PAS domain S-box-containing protein